MTDPNNTTAADLVITRVFDAPRELVWQAWTDPAHFQRWWGPANYTAPVSQIDLRVGGRYLASMQSPEGQVYYSTGVYNEIVPPERLVYTDSFADEHGNPVSAAYYGMGDDDFPMEQVIMLTFEDLGGKTSMTLTQYGAPEGEAREMTEMGWNQSFDKLASTL